MESINCHSPLGPGQRMYTSTCAWEGPSKQRELYLQWLTISPLRDAMSSGPYWNFACRVDGGPLTTDNRSLARWLELRCCTRWVGQGLGGGAGNGHENYLYLHGCSSPVPFNSAGCGDKLPSLLSSLTGIHVVFVKHLSRSRYKQSGHAV